MDPNRATRALARVRSQTPRTRVVEIAKAFLVSRLLVAIGLVIGEHHRSGNWGGRGFWAWDGAWFHDIAKFGYGPSPAAGVEGRWPFFPLLPGLLHVARSARLPEIAILVVVNHLLLLVAMFGLWTLAERRFGAATARWSVWTVAVFPMTAVFSMLYASSLFLATSVWAFEMAERRRWASAGVIAALAAAARPNGASVALVLMVAVAVTVPKPDRPRVIAQVAGPTALFVMVWVWWCRYYTGDALAFMTAKSAWKEQTIVTFLRRQFHHLHPDAAVLHLGLGVVAVAVLVLTWRRLPAAWRWFAVITLAVPLVTGVVGVGRYAGECFPMLIAAGAVLERLPSRVRVAAISISLLGSVAAAITIASMQFVP